MSKTMNPKPTDETVDNQTDLEQPENNPAQEQMEPTSEKVSTGEATAYQVEEESVKTEEAEPVSTQAKAEVMPEIEYSSIMELDNLEKEYSESEFESLAKMYDETMTDFTPGEVVVGKVLAVNDKEVSVDIGFKSEGTIPIDEFPDPNNVVIGENIEVLIDDIEDVEGYLVLSKRKADFMRLWEKIIHSYENDEVLPGKCTRRIKGGIVVDLGGVDAFLPGSQIDVRPIRDFDALIGETMDFKIVKVNHMRKNIVVSHRVLVERELRGQRERILEELERGQVLEGVVKNITDFGVFIDLGGVDGLLHINDLSWGRVSYPSEIVSLDERIKVVVLDFNEEKDRISLGLKQLQPHPWEHVESKYPVDSVVKGKVVSISDYGAFVELEKGVEGLIHISEMSWTQHIKHPSKILAVGEVIEAKVLSIQKDERKISLGLKQLEPDPWQSLAERYPVLSHHTGVVRNLTNFGAFVELEEGIDGLIHISDLSWTKKIRHPGEVLKKGDEIEVVVLNVDRDNRRISLGFKQTQDNPWDYFEQKYKAGTVTEGKVVRLIEKGLIVELPEVVDGFVPISQLAKENLSKPADGYQIDDIIKLIVIEFNKESKKIVLSEKALLRQAHEAKPGTAVLAKAKTAPGKESVKHKEEAAATPDAEAKKMETAKTDAEAKEQTETEAVAVSDTAEEMAEKQELSGQPEEIIEAVAPADEAEVTVAAEADEEKAEDSGESSSSVDEEIAAKEPDESAPEVAGTGEQEEESKE
jgi:small subunit ribosomal protein S1